MKRIEDSFAYQCEQLAKAKRRFCLLLLVDLRRAWRWIKRKMEAVSG